MAATNVLFNVPTAEGGVFKRAPAAFRNIIARGSKDFPADPTRLEIFLATACPWCHRVALTLALKGLDKTFKVTYVEPRLVQTTGWSFNKQQSGAKFANVREIYELSQPGYEGRLTVPILFDWQEKRIVNNESSEIIRMLNTEFNDFSATPQQKELDLYPAALRQTIDDTNEWVLRDFNNGVYQAGFAQSQQAYEDAATRVFAAADKLEAILGKSTYLVSNDRLTEADVRAFPTALRFDSVYHFHFKLNKKRMEDFPNIWRWMKLIYNLPGVSDTVNMDETVEHYYWSHNQINPFRIVPQLASITDKLASKSPAAL